MKTVKKNLLFMLLFGTFGLLMFQACEEDPIFPDPGFEITDQRVEVRRDTADYYNIHTAMKVPNKVKEILLLDGLDYEELETINDYNGQANFDFDYLVDLREIVKDSVLNYIIKVIDQDGRSFNQGIRISVKGFSFPEIKLVGGNNVAVAAPAYTVKGLVSTGLNTIETIRVVFEGVEYYNYQAVAGEEVSELDIAAIVFLGNLEEGQSYPIEIIITDNVGQESTTIVHVRKSTSIAKPTKIIYTNTGVSTSTQTEIIPTYNENQELIKFAINFASGVVYQAEFEYNDIGMVSKYIYTSFDSSGGFDRKSYFYFNYVEGTKQLIDIDYQVFNYDENGNITGESAISKEASEFVYDGDTNKVLSFRRSSIVSNIYYSDPFGLGEDIYGEYFQINSYMSSNTVRRQHREDYDPVLISTYNEGLPPFTDAVSSVMFTVFQDILYNKYMMTKTVNTDPSYSDTYLTKPAYTYETDEDGKITLITAFNTEGTFQTQGNTRSYAFFYLD
ncbi:hypothetical protein [Tamlana flava]|uniref:hypothetical protein n=1 Tax=Tamlana flava TaxID=3158572 RepID=UPI00351BE9FD